MSNVITATSTSPPFLVEKWSRGTPYGYGSDSGGGNTAGLLVALEEEFGAVASFAGTYRADSWNWNLPTVNVQIYPTSKTGEKIN